MTAFDEFAHAARLQGFDEVVERRWQPDTMVETHRHPFAVKALVVQGKMWLEVEGSVRELAAGDEFELARDVAHSERYGGEGATYWAARKR